MFVHVKDAKGAQALVRGYDTMGTTAEPDDTVTAVHRIKQEIDRLTERQAHALKQATYVGMTPEEAKEYDQRRSEITKLLRQLEVLEKGAMTGHFGVESRARTRQRTRDLD